MCGEMAQLQEKAREIVHAVEHPVEVAKQLEHEAEEGDSARTPLIALVGVALVALVIFVIMLSIAMTLYYLNGG
jgi:hypothetical protein